MEYVADSLPSLLGTLASAVPIMQTQYLHEREMQAALELHRQAIRQAAEHHAEGIALEKELFREQLKVDLAHHLEDIRLVIESARRENLRDVWAQKSRRAETLLIMSSLMIGGFFTLIVDGFPALDIWPALLAVYSATLSSSFALLFLALFLSMKYQARMNEYNIYKPDQIYVCGDKHESFESYYDCHCAGPARVATYLFYGGTLLLLLSAAFLQFARYYLTFQTPAAAFVYASVVAATFGGIYVTNWLVPTKTRHPHTQTEVEAAQSDAKAMDEGRMGPGPAFGGKVSFLRRSSGKPVVTKRKKKATTEAEASSSLKTYLEGLRGLRERRGSVFSQPHLHPNGGAEGMDMTRFMDDENRAILKQTMMTLPTQSTDASARSDDIPLVPMSTPVVEMAQPAPKRFKDDLEEVVTDLR